MQAINNTVVRLYQITEQYHQAISALAELDLSPEEMSDNLAGIEESFKDKALNVAAYIKNLEASIEVLDSHLQALKARKDYLKNQKTRLTEYLRYNMQAADIKKIESAEFDIKISACPPRVVIVEEAEIDPDYLKVKITKTPDKEKIKTDLKNGKEVKGAYLESGTSLTIR